MDLDADDAEARLFGARARVARARAQLDVARRAYFAASEGTTSLLRPAFDAAKRELDEAEEGLFRARTTVSVSGGTITRPDVYGYDRRAHP